MSSVETGRIAGAEADDAALAVGISVAAGVEASVGRDGAGTPVVDVAREGWLAAAGHVRDVLGMDYLDWLSAVDRPDADPPGLDVVLHVAASASAGPDGERPPGGAPDATARRVRRLLLRTPVPDSDLTLPSLTGLWPGVAWHERETFEMFGVAFTDFVDGSAHGLRPLLLPEGFEGTPLRKSFVLAARAAKAWPGAKEPGESGEHRAPSGRKLLPPGVPDPSWGPHEPAPGPNAAEPGPERP